MTAMHQAISETMLEARGLSVSAPAGRVLVRDLDVRLGREKLALVGRNGAGKSSLLETLAGVREPDVGTLERRGGSLLVDQELSMAAIDRIGRAAHVDRRDVAARVVVELEAAGLSLELARQVLAGQPSSGGERRKLALAIARVVSPSLLFLDEPTRDLDRAGVSWLLRWLEAHQGTVVVVSHDRRLLSRFDQFVRVSEAGCRPFAGSFSALELEIERDEQRAQERYLINLNQLEARERHNDIVARRRRRKKNVGRIREIRRAPSRAKLNSKRSYAQESQGKRRKLQEDRINKVRQWARESRRALRVRLPLEAVMPRLPVDDGAVNLSLEAVSASVGGRTLFAGLDLSVARERVAVVGANGTGKTTLLRVLCGEQPPSAGRVSARRDRIGVIGQGAAEWAGDESLISRLAGQRTVGSLDELTQLVLAHRFPMALAERSMASLCPGERVRAALICLLAREPAPEVLVLDEPSAGLDLVGASALRSFLAAWPGGLVLASHDDDLLDTVRFDRSIVLGDGDHRAAGKIRSETPNDNLRRG